MPQRVCPCPYHRVLSLDGSSFESRFEAVEGRIQRAVERSRRSRSDINLVAVSKKFSAAAIREAYGAGLRDFGENYVQEFAEKSPELKALSDARFHLIGHLQSNKARLACDLFKVIQTVDSAKLLRRLDVAAAVEAGGHRLAGHEPMGGHGDRPARADRPARRARAPSV